MDGVRLFFAGDFCCTPSPSHIEVAEDLRHLIQSCDVKYVNFEVPLKPEVTLPRQYNARLWQHDDAPGFLRDLGFNLFSIANNHAFDWGVAGFDKTRRALGDQAFGAGTYEEAYRVKTVEVRGVRIGFMALTFAAYTGVFDDVQHRDGVGCAYIHDLRVNHDIMEAKKSVDFLFILPHDGVEYVDVPLPETIARYRDFIDYGADGVLGSHPHCPQGWEEYNGKPIFYSLGNFFFNSKETPLYKADKPHWYEGWCVLMEVNPQADKPIQFRIINTKNEENRHLMIDDSADRQRHNEVLQQYLTDKILYDTYLNTQLEKIAVETELPIVMSVRQKLGVIFSIKMSLRSIVHRNSSENGARFSHLLKNDTRLDVLKRYLKEQK